MWGYKGMINQCKCASQTGKSYNEETMFPIWNFFTSREPIFDFSLIQDWINPKHIIIQMTVRVRAPSLSRWMTPCPPSPRPPSPATRSSSWTITIITTGTIPEMVTPLDLWILQGMITKPYNRLSILMEARHATNTKKFPLTLNWLSVNPGNMLHLPSRLCSRHGSYMGW